MDSGLLCQEHFNERGKQGFPASSRVVHKFKEPEVEGKSLLRYAPMWAKPGAQERPETLDGVDMDLMVSISVLVSGVFSGKHGRQCCEHIPTVSFGHKYRTHL